MKLSEVRNTYYEFSGKLSDLSRKLCFAGIAIVWIFRSGKASDIKYDGVLVLPLLLFVVALSFDILQYIWGSFIWGRFARKEERKGTKDDYDLDAPDWYNNPSLFFFWTKHLLTISSYFLLIRFLVDKI